MNPLRLILQDGGDAWVYVPVPSSACQLEVGGKLAEPAAKRGWWRLEPPLRGANLYIVHPPGRRITHYECGLGPTVSGYPALLDVDKFEACNDPDSASYDRRVHALYEPFYEATPPRRELVEGAWMFLEGAPPPDDYYIWHGSLPSELRYAPEYLHLFPGHLEGFREAAQAALGELPGVQAYAAGNEPAISVYAHVQLPPLSPIAWEKPNRPAVRRRKNAASRAPVTRSLLIPAPKGIEGENRAAAVEEWERRMASIVDYVRAIIADVCPACEGRGFIEPGRVLFPPLREVLSLVVEANLIVSHNNNAQSPPVDAMWQAESLLEKASLSLSKIADGLDAGVLEDLIERHHPKGEADATVEA